MTNKIHIGKTIKELINTQGVSVTDFADKISCTPRNVYKIFSKSDIDTALLSRINNALGQNLFLLYLSDNEIQGYKTKGREASVFAVPSGLIVSSAYLNGFKKTN